MSADTAPRLKHPRARWVFSVVVEKFAKGCSLINQARVLALAIPMDIALRDRYDE